MMKKKSIFDGLKKQARKDRERGMISTKDAVEVLQDHRKIRRKEIDL